MNFERYVVSTSALTSCSLNAESEFLVSGTATGQVVLSNPWTRQSLVTLSGGHSQVVSDCAFHESNRWVVSSGLKEPVSCVWDVNSCKIVRRLGQKGGHQRGVTCCGFWGTDGVFTAGLDGRSFLWDLRTPSGQVYAFTEAADAVTGFHLTDGQDGGGCGQALVSSMDGFVRTTDLRYGLEKCEFLNYGVVALAVALRDMCYAVACMNGSIYLRDREAGALAPDLFAKADTTRPLNRFYGHQPILDFNKIAFSQDSSRIWSPTGAGGLCSWRLTEEASARLDLAFPPGYGQPRGVIMVRDNLPTIRTAARRAAMAPGGAIAWCDDGTVVRIAQAALQNERAS